MSKTPNTPSIPAPQFVIFDPPIPGFEARAEIKKAEKKDWVLDESTYDPIKFGNSESALKYIVLTPVKRIEDLLPVCRVECWAAQFESGLWALCAVLPEPISGGKWKGIANGWVNLPSEQFNPFGLPASENPDWKSQLYHFTPGQGWRKCEVGK